MSKRLAAAVVALASIAAPAAAEDREPVDVGGIPCREPADVGRALVPRGPDPAPLPDEPLSVRLVWVDPAEVAGGVAVPARAEARRLLGKMGVSASWRRGRPGETARPGEVRVILLDRGVTRAPGVPVLGATPARVEATPFVWVHLPNVRAAVGLDPGHSATAGWPASSRALALAIGRVVAHELVHALAPAVPHGTGLMSARLSRRQLTAVSLPVEGEVVLAVRAALRGAPTPPPGGSGTLAAAAAEQETER